MVSITPKELRRALSQVLPCVEKRDNRPALQHILCRLEGGLTLVATDGFRLGIAKLEIGGLPLSLGEWLVHFQEARELQEALKAARGVSLKVDQGNLAFGISLDGEERIITIPPKEYQYPKVERLIPTSFTSQAIFQAKEMKRALGEVKIKGSWVWAIRMYVGEGQIRIVAEDQEGVKKETVIEAQTQGEATRIGFERRYLGQMVKALDGEITLRIFSPSSPGLFESGASQWLIMPLFLGWW